jgi:DNA-binding FadR family transcriptional regulator
MLALGDAPDPALVDQILQVLGSLVALAAETATARASEREIETIRARLRPLLAGTPGDASYAEARFELMSAIMEASGNLVCRLIARSLLLQFVPRMAALEVQVVRDDEAHRTFARQLDAALVDRDVPRVRELFESMSKINRDYARRALTAVSSGDLSAGAAAGLRAPEARLS